MITTTTAPTPTEVTWKFKGTFRFGKITSIEEDTETHLIFRYTTPTIEGLYNPLMKFDKTTGRIHFASSVEGFEKRGYAGYVN